MPGSTRDGTSLVWSDRPVRSARPPRMSERTRASSRWSAWTEKRAWPARGRKAKPEATPTPQREPFFLGAENARSFSCRATPLSVDRMASGPARSMVATSRAGWRTPSIGSAPRKSNSFSGALCPALSHAIRQGAEKALYRGRLQPSAHLRDLRRGHLVSPVRSDRLPRKTGSARPLHRHGERPPVAPQRRPMLGTPHDDEAALGMRAFPTLIGSQYDRNSTY